jgi:hypothetical protein
LVAIAAALSIAGATPLLPRAALVNGLEDDAFYYLQIARNVSAGHGFTFDTLHRTNGFHPLWLFCLVPLTRLAPGDFASVRLLLCLQLFLVVLSCVELTAALLPRIGAWPAIAAALMMVALPGSQLVLFRGMESALLLWLLTRCWRSLAWLTEEARPAHAWLRLGAWCSLAFLARLEAGIITLVIVIITYRHWRNRTKLLLSLIAFPTITITGYLIWNRLCFQLWIPVSGLIKASALFYDNRTIAERLFGSYTPLTRLIAVTGVDQRAPRLAFALYCCALTLLALFAVAHHQRLRSCIAGARIGGALAMCLAIWLLENLFLPLGATWYPVAPLLGTALLVGAIAAAQAHGARALAIALVVLGVGRATLHAWRDWRLQDSVTIRALEAAQWARDNIPANERIGSWNAGLFAYFSHRLVINLDGLVNDADFYRQTLLKRQFAQYVASEHISWFADGVYTAESLQRPTYGITTDQATMPVKLVYRACDWRLGVCSGYGVWRLQ